MGRTTSKPPSQPETMALPPARRILQPRPWRVWSHRSPALRRISKNCRRLNFDIETPDARVREAAERLATNRLDAVPRKYTCVWVRPNPVRAQQMPTPSFTHHPKGPRSPIQANAEWARWGVIIELSRVDVVRPLHRAFAPMPEHLGDEFSIDARLFLKGVVRRCPEGALPGLPFDDAP